MVFSMLGKVTLARMVPQPPKMLNAALPVVHQGFFASSTSTCSAKMSSRGNARNRFLPTVNEVPAPCRWAWCSVTVSQVHRSGNATKRVQQAVQALIVNDLAGANLPRPDGHVADALVRALGVVMVDVGSDGVSQRVFTEKHDVIETFLPCRTIPALDERIHIRGMDAGPHGAVAKDGGGVRAIFPVIIKNQMFAFGERCAHQGGRAQRVGDPGVGRVSGDAEQLHAAGVVLDGAEDEGIDDLSEEANRNLQKVDANELISVAIPELGPGRSATMIVCARWSPMCGQDTAHGGFCDRHARLRHFADDARVSGAASIVDTHNSIDFCLANPWSCGFGARRATIGVPLLVSLEPADETVERNQPVEQITEGMTDDCGPLGMLETFGVAQAQTFPREVTARSIELAVAGTEQCINRHTESGADGQPQGALHAHGQRQQFSGKGVWRRMIGWHGAGQGGQWWEHDKTPAKGFRHAA